MLSFGKRDVHCDCLFLFIEACAGIAQVFICLFTVTVGHKKSFGCLVQAEAGLCGLQFHLFACFVAAQACHQGFSLGCFYFVNAFAPMEQGYL